MLNIQRFGRPLIIAFFIYAVLTVFFTYGLVSHPGVLGDRQDWNFPVDSNGLVKMFQSSLQLLNPDDLGTVPVYPTDILFRFCVGLLGYVGISGSLFAEGYVPFCILLSAATMNRFVWYLRSNPYGAFIAGLFYMTTPLLYNKIVAGHAYYILAYAVAPLFLLEFERSLQEKSAFRQVVHALWAGLLFSICGFQIQFFIMLSLLVLFFGVYHWHQKRIYFLNAVIVGITAILLNLPWLVFNFNFSTIQQTAQNAVTLSWLAQQSNHWLYDIGLSGYYFDYFTWRFQNNQMDRTAILCFSIFLLLSTLFSWRQKYVKVVFAFTALGLIFSMGSNPPFGSLVAWLFLHIPVFSIFREIYHFMFIPSFGYAVLLGLTIRKPNWKMASAVAATVFFTFPYYKQGLGKDVSYITYNSRYQSLMQSLSGSPNRVGWLPAFQPGSFNGNTYTGIDIMESFSPAPSLWQQGEVSDYSHHVQYSLYQDLIDGDPALGKTLGQYNIGSLIFRNNYRSVFSQSSGLRYFPNRQVKWLPSQIQHAVESAKDMSVAANTPSFVEYKNEDNLPILYPVDAVDGVSGSLQTIYDANAFSSQPTAYLLNTSASHTIYGDNDFIDGRLANVEDKVTLTPGNNARVDDDATQGWASTYNWWWYDAAISAFPQNGIITTKPKAVFSFAASTTPGPVEVLMKVYKSPQGGTVRISVNHKLYTIQTKDISKDDFEWVDLGVQNIGAKTDIQVDNENGVNALGEVCLVPSTSWVRANNNFQSFALVINSKNNWYPNVGNAGRITDSPSGMNVDVPVTGDYAVASDIEVPQAVQWFDNGKPAHWNNGRLFLTKGQHRIAFQSNAKDVTVHRLMLSRMPPVEQNATPLPFTKINNSEYKLHIHSQQASTVVFSTNHTPGWVIQSDKGSVSPFPVNGYANGFHLPAGDYDAVLVFKPQVMYRDLVYGSVGLTAMILVLFVGSRRTTDNTRRHGKHRQRGNGQRGKHRHQKSRE